MKVVFRCIPFRIYHWLVNTRENEREYCCVCPLLCQLFYFDKIVMSEIRPVYRQLKGYAIGYYEFSLVMVFTMLALLHKPIYYILYMYRSIPCVYIMLAKPCGSGLFLLQEVWSHINFPPNFFIIFLKHFCLLLSVVTCVVMH